jgi:hypothetical protein
MQSYNFQKSAKRNQNPSRYYNFVINFKFQHWPQQTYTYGCCFLQIDLTMMSKLEVGLQQQFNMLQHFCAEHGLMVNVKKTKVMVFNFVDPC